MGTGTCTQVAETARSGAPRMRRASCRMPSSSEVQPASPRAPTHGTTLSASGAGNRELSPSLSHRRSHVARLLAQPAVARHHGELVVQLLDAGPPGTGGGLVRRENEPGELPAVVQGTQPRSSRGGGAGAGHDPQGRTRACAGLTPGTTSGTSRFARKAPLLSTTTAPRDAATGAHSAATSLGTSNTATSTPSKTSGPIGRGSVLAADRELPSGRA